MSKNALTKRNEFLPSFVEDFFKPWDRWFTNGFEKMSSMPAVNVIENKDDYKITVAAPGLKKSDFKIDVENNMLSISAEKEENKEEKDANYTRREYNYSSFSRTFTLPDNVIGDKIDARYEDGVLKLTLPKKEEATKLATKTIAVK